MVPRTFKALPANALVEGLVMMDSTFGTGLFELIKEVKKGKDTFHYYVTTYDIANRIVKKNRPFPNFFGSITFSQEITYLRATRAELEEMYLVQKPKKPESSPENKVPPAPPLPENPPPEPKPSPVKIPRLVNIDPADEDSEEDEAKDGADQTQEQENAGQDHTPKDMEG